MNDDGSMARREDLERFAEQHGLKIGTIADLIHYRTTNERTIELLDENELDTEYGVFSLRTYRDTIQGGHSSGDGERRYFRRRAGVCPGAHHRHPA